MEGKQVRLAGVSWRPQLAKAWSRKSLIELGSKGFDEARDGCPGIGSVACLRARMFTAGNSQALQSCASIYGIDCRGPYAAQR